MLGRRRPPSPRSNGQASRSTNWRPCPAPRVHEIDADGIHGGGVRQALRALQSVTTEGNHLRHYEAELAQGHLVVDVTVHGQQKRDTVVQVLRSYGAHFINAYGPWTIENVAA